MRTCSIVEQLCTDRVPAAMRLQSVIGREDVQELVVPLARRLIERTSPVCQEHAGHCIAAA